jgi:hypothetical protein
LRGRSTPAILAIAKLLSLPLLVAGVLALHADHALAADHLAVFADLLDRSSYLHDVLDGSTSGDK